MQADYIQIITQLGACGWCYLDRDWRLSSLNILIKKGIVTKGCVLGESNHYSLSDRGRYIYDALVSVASLIYSMEDK
jgi:hypothetical protein